MDKDDHEAIGKEFRDAVNMTPAEIETWLETPESNAVGWTPAGEAESVGHQNGRRLVQIRRTRKADLTDDDYATMQKIVGYIHRHMAQRPDGDITNTRWRFSLMNWGHDPVKG